MNNKIEMYTSGLKPRILIIGQAPALKTQVVPYDTTLLYMWLAELGIDKETAQYIFEFEAVSKEFNGYVEGTSGHKAPSQKQMMEHWPLLEEKIHFTNKVWLVGAVAAKFFNSQPKTWSCNLQVIETLHPSKRNLHKFRQVKEHTMSQIKTLIFS